MKNILLLIVLLAVWLMPALACTSAVVSGRVTPDGRPLLWKHRDTDFLQNHVEYVCGEKYDFIAVVNSADFHQKREAWIGTNSAGFALMNTQSYNRYAHVLNDPLRYTDPSGELMRTQVVIWMSFLRIHLYHSCGLRFHMLPFPHTQPRNLSTSPFAYVPKKLYFSTFFQKR